jgi:hypothetical protein
MKELIICFIVDLVEAWEEQGKSEGKEGREIDKFKQYLTKIM